MSGSTSSLLARGYDGIICSSLTERALDCLYNGGCFSHQLYDTKLVTVLKNVGYKASRLGIAVLAPIELVARSALSLIAYGFSLISTPVELTLKAPVSLLFYRELPRMSISKKIYQLGYDLCYHNRLIAEEFGASISNFLFYGNNLTQRYLN